jgi:enoyl-[acyl-carrier protein] reductase/trans-2-enoyl-CoA reductase (NAD+)
MPLEIVAPRSRGFLFINSHPAGCAAMVSQQIELARASRPANAGGDCALVIGASTGYGLASRIACAFGHEMKTVGVFYERPPAGKKTATAGWYNTAAFHQAAQAQGLPSANFNGDAFSNQIKSQVVERLRGGIGPIDLLVYSLASPVRVHPDTGETLRSVLKPVGQAYTTKTIDLDKEQVTEMTIEPAAKEEMDQTVAVMGGDDLRRWVDVLLEAKLFADAAKLVAYSYIGPEMTWPIYRSGAIGRAKLDLERSAAEIDRKLQARISGRAWVSVNKAVVTQASAAIPGVPLYLSLLHPALTSRGLEEYPIDQALRLLKDHLADDATPKFDAAGRIRLDDREMREDVQAEIAQRWERITTESLRADADFDGFKTDFRRLFGFEVKGVDYSRPVETEVALELG